MYFQCHVMLTLKNYIVSIKIIFHHVLHLFGKDRVMNKYSVTNPLLWYHILLYIIEILLIILRISTEGFRLDTILTTHTGLNKATHCGGFFFVCFCMCYSSFRFGGKFFLQRISRPRISVCWGTVFKLLQLRIYAVCTESSYLHLLISQLCAFLHSEIHPLPCKLPARPHNCVSWVLETLMWC